MRAAERLEFERVFCFFLSAQKEKQKLGFLFVHTLENKMTSVFKKQESVLYRGRLVVHHDWHNQHQQVFIIFLFSWKDDACTTWL